MSKGEAALTAVAGVDEASINLATSTATVTFSGEINAISELTNQYNDNKTGNVLAGYVEIFQNACFGRLFSVVAVHLLSYIILLSTRFVNITCSIFM